MSQFVVIGLSAFGEVLAQKLYSLGEEVIVLDQKQERIQEVKDNVTEAIIADATDGKILSKILTGTDATVIICLGDSLEQSVIVTYQLTQLGVKKIIAKANNIEQGNVLKILGANQIIYPERDMALKIAENLNNPNLLASLSLGKNYAIVEIHTPQEFIGKSLVELDLRNKYQVNVVAVKQTQGEESIIIPWSDYAFKEDDCIIALGKKEDIQNFEKLAKK